MAWKIEQRGESFVVIAADGAEAGTYAVKAAAEAHLAIAAKGMSFDAIRQRLQSWAETTYPPKRDADGCMSGWTYIHDVYTDRFIYRDNEGKTWQRSYALVGSELTVGEPTEVQQTWEEVKAAGDTVVYQGDAVKALGNGKVGGYLVRFGSAEKTDNSAFKDYFDASTDFDVDFDKEGAAKSTVYYHHGQDDVIGLKRLGKGVKGSLKRDDVGVWIEAQLNMADEYEAAMYGAVEKKKIGWSSGTAAHLVQREAVKVEGKTVAHHIKYWPLGLDSSLTPTPAEFTARAVALKSLDVPSFAELAAEADIQISGEPTSETKTLAEHAQAVVTACEGYATRLETRCEARVKAGRVLSAANVAELEEVQSALDGLTALHSRIAGLLEKARPKQDPEPASEAKAETDRLRTETLRLTTRLRSVTL